MNHKNLCKDTYNALLGLRDTHTVEKLRGVELRRKLEAATV